MWDVEHGAGKIKNCSYFYFEYLVAGVSAHREVFAVP